MWTRGRVTFAGAHQYRRLKLKGARFSGIIARVYDLISVLQITRLLLGDATISSKTNPRNSNKKEKRTYGKVRNSKIIIKILSFIQILYLKQQSNIMRCFCGIEFGKSLITNKFFSFIRCSKMSYNHLHNTLRIFDVLPNFNSNKQGIYELPHELPNDLRLN